MNSEIRRLKTILKSLIETFWNGSSDRAAASMEKILGAFFAEHANWDADELAATVEAAGIYEHDYMKRMFQSDSSDIPSRTIEFGMLESQITIRLLGRLNRPDLLMQLALNDKVVWYTRAKSLECIGDASYELDWNPLMDLVEDGRVEGEVRAAALKAITSQNRTELLPRIQDLAGDENAFDQWWDGDFKVTSARGFLGDESVVGKLLEQRFSIRSTIAWHAGKAWDAFVEKVGGVENVARAIARQLSFDEGQNEDEIWNSILSSSNPNFRRLAVEQVASRAEPENQSEDQAMENIARVTDQLLEQLRDEDWHVRHETCNRLKQVSNCDDRLLEIFQDANESRVTRSWSAYCLVQRGKPVRELSAIVESYELWFVPWEFNSPTHLRRAIVNAYGLNATNGSDIRYRLEAELNKENDAYSEQDADNDRNNLIDLLRSGGINISSVRDAGEVYSQGAGSFYVIDLGGDSIGDQIFVSTFGPYLMYPSAPNTKHDSDTSKTCKTIAKEAGYFLLEKPLLQQIVPGLNVYFFGHVEPLSVQDLVFYWKN